MIDREEFEAWARGSDYEVDYVPEFGCYPNVPTEWAWQAWQAARATAEQSRAEDAHVIKRLSGVLAEVAAALFGEEADGNAADILAKLPERAATLTLEVELYRVSADRNNVIEECCAAIKAKDDLAADDDYMLDSNDCIKVCRALKSQQDAAIESKLAEQSLWQPIETAPKTGRTLLLGYPNSLGNWRTVRGEWLTQEYIDQNWEEPDEAEAGWYETSVEADDVPSCWPITPTHWQPLPKPPADAAIESQRSGDGESS